MSESKLDALTERVRNDALRIEIEVAKENPSLSKINQLKQKFFNDYGYEYPDSKKLKKNLKKFEKQIKKIEQWNRGKPNNKKIPVTRELQILNKNALVGEIEKQIRSYLRIRMDSDAIDNMMKDAETSIDELANSIFGMIACTCKDVMGIQLCEYNTSKAEEIISEYFTELIKNGTIITTIEEIVSSIEDTLEEKLTPINQETQVVDNFINTDTVINSTDAVVNSTDAVVNSTDAVVNSTDTFDEDANTGKTLSLQAKCGIGIGLVAICVAAAGGIYKLIKCMQKKNKQLNQVKNNNNSTKKDNNGVSKDSDVTGSYGQQSSLREISVRQKRDKKLQTNLIQVAKPQANKAQNQAQNQAQKVASPEVANDVQNNNNILHLGSSSKAKQNDQKNI